MAGDRLVHRVVEDFGDQMVQRALVGAADIHAGPAADRLQPLEDLDVLGGIALAKPVREASNRSVFLPSCFADKSGQGAIRDVCRTRQRKFGSNRA